MSQLVERCVEMEQVRTQILSAYPAPHFAAGLRERYAARLLQALSETLQVGALGMLA